VYIDYGVFDVGPNGSAVRELFGDVTLERMEKLTGLPLARSQSGERATPMH